ncbi:MAG TPA: hypothetical protein VI488_22070 [Candidatus Angelobacter sp.]
MKNRYAAGILCLLWFLSMVFYLPLPAVVLLFAAWVAAATLAAWTAWTKGQLGRAGRVVKPDAKALNS